MHLVSDLLDLTPESALVFDEAVRTGRYANHRYADLLDAIGAGRIDGLAGHAVGDALLEGSRAGGGLLTRADLVAYKAVGRDPLAIDRAGARIWTNPSPSVGGSIVTGALSRLPKPAGHTPVRWAEVAEALADATLAQRGPGQVSTGTTHVSVVDARGRLRGADHVERLRIRNGRCRSGEWRSTTCSARRTSARLTGPLCRRVPGWGR